MKVSLLMSEILSRPLNGAAASSTDCDNPRSPMDPSRKRRIRLGVALSAAVLLAAALIYTSFSASSEAVEPSQLVAHADRGRSYHLTGKVVNGSISKVGDGIRFQVRDRKATAGSRAIWIRYSGSVPDPFKDGREVIVDVREGAAGTFVGQRDSLITKCPSKFSAKQKQT
jgi:cytochrome c-type biogenesis protein CcmE